MLFISLSSCITLFMLLKFYAKVNFYLSFLFSSIMFISSHFGHEFPYSYVFLMLSTIFLLLFDRRCILKTNQMVWLPLVLIFVFIILNLSLINGAAIELNLLKFLQVFFIVLSLTLLTHYKSSYITSKYKHKRIIKSFFVVNLLFGFLAHMLFGVYDLGLFRFSGITFDANYFSLFAVCLLFITYTKRFSKLKNVNLTRLFIIALLLLAGSATIIFVFLVFLLFRLLSPRFLMNTLSYLAITVLAFYSYVGFVGYLKNMQFSSDGNTIVQYKLTSMQMRLEPQIKALELLNDNNAWFTGFGSGRNIQLTGKAVHNGPLQQVFSHGIIYFCFFSAFVAYILNVLVKRHESEKELLYGVFYSLTIISFFLDPLFILAFHFFILIFKVTYCEPFLTCDANIRQEKRS